MIEDIITFIYLRVDSLLAKKLWNEAPLPSLKSLDTILLVHKLRVTAVFNHLVLWVLLLIVLTSYTC